MVGEYKTGSLDNIKNFQMRNMVLQNTIISAYLWIVSKHRHEGKHRVAHADFHNKYIVPTTLGFYQGYFPGLHRLCI